MGDVSAGEHHSVVFGLFLAKNPSSRGISIKSITSELRHIASVLAPCSLTWSVGMMSIFEIARLTNIGSKTEYRTHTSLEMSRNNVVTQPGPQSELPS